MKSLSNTAGIAGALLMTLASCGREEPTRSATQGRLTIAGEGAQYVYDGAGNILQVIPAVSPPPTVARFAPGTGGVGEIVTIFGSGFGPAEPVNVNETTRC
jgi:hypothetical protein